MTNKIKKNIQEPQKVAVKYFISLFKIFHNK